MRFLVATFLPFKSEKPMKFSKSYSLLSFQIASKPWDKIYFFIFFFHQVCESFFKKSIKLPLPPQNCIRRGLLNLSLINKFSFFAFS